MRRNARRPGRRRVPWPQIPYAVRCRGWYSCTSSAPGTRTMTTTPERVCRSVPELGPLGTQLGHGRLEVVDDEVDGLVPRHRRAVVHRAGRMDPQLRSDRSGRSATRRRRCRRRRSRARPRPGRTPAWPRRRRSRSGCGRQGSSRQHPTGAPRRLGDEVATLRKRVPETACACQTPLGLGQPATLE